MCLTTFTADKLLKSLKYFLISRIWKGRTMPRGNKLIFLLDLESAGIVNIKQEMESK